jgi:hypothetical protein
MASTIEVMAALQYMAAAYPNFKLTKDTGKVYTEHLADIPLEQLQRITKRAIDTCDWFPTVSKLREIIAQDVASQNHVPLAFEAWGELMEAISEFGHLNEPIFSHPLVKRVVDNLGWYELCMSENTIADRARFIQAYEQALKEAITQVRYIPSVRSGTMQLISSMTAQLEKGKAKQ